MSTQSTAHQVVWFDLPCLDLDRAISFYSAVLGCEIPKQEMGPGFALGILPHEQNTVGGCLVVTPDNPPSEHGLLVYLNCQGRLDAAISAARERGGKILIEKHSIAPHGERAVILDSEGNRVALHSM